jgi:hypothetical protein
MGIIQQSNQAVLIVISSPMLKIALCTPSKALTSYKYAAIALDTQLVCWIYATHPARSIYMEILGC